MSRSQGDLRRVERGRNWLLLGTSPSKQTDGARNDERQTREEKLGGRQRQGKAKDGWHILTTGASVGQHKQIGERLHGARMSV